MTMIKLRGFTFAVGGFVAQCCSSVKFRYRSSLAVHSTSASVKSCNIADGAE